MDAWQNGRRRSLHDHMTAAGDVQSFAYEIRVMSRAREVLRTLDISISASGAFQVSGTITDGAMALQVLENARDAVGGYHLRAGGISIPGRDVTIDGLEDVAEVTVRGPIENREYTIALFDNVRDAIRERMIKTPLVHRADHGLTVKAL